MFAFFATQGGDINASSFSNTSEDAIQSTIIPTPTTFVSAHPDPAAYFPPSFDYSSFYVEPSTATTVPEYTTTTSAVAIPDWTENSTCFDFNFSSSYVEPVPLSFFEPPPPPTTTIGGVDATVPFGLEIDVPQFDFQSLGDSSEIREGADRMLDALFNFGYCEWL